MHLVADRRLAEEDAAVGRDVEIVGKPQPRIVDDREPRAVGLVGQLLDRAVLRDAIEPHAADAAEQRAVAREGHAERASADMGEDLLPAIVGREEADDVAGAVADIDVVVVVEDDVLRPVDLAEPDQLDRTQPVVERIGRSARPWRAPAAARHRSARHRPSTAPCGGSSASGRRWPPPPAGRGRAAASWRRCVTPRRTRPLAMIITVIAPMIALAAEPRPPPRLLPPSTAAVSAVISRPTPVSAPAPPSRDAKRSPASAAQRAGDDIGQADRRAAPDADIVGRAARAADRQHMPARHASGSARDARATASDHRQRRR